MWIEHRKKSPSNQSIKARLSTCHILVPVGTSNNPLQS
jgi:hypothetical protein